MLFCSEFPLSGWMDKRQNFCDLTSFFQSELFWGRSEAEEGWSDQAAFWELS